MPVETGNLARLAYSMEAAFGVLNPTPTGQVVRQVGFNLDADRNYIDNTELRIDGMVPAGRGGALRGKGSLSGKLSYGTYDDFFAMSLGNFSWNANVIKIRPGTIDSATTLAVAAAGKTFTRPTGDYTADGFKVGDYFYSSGFANAGNNGSFLISAVTALVVTCSTATGLVDESATANGSITLNNRPSASFEKGHLANGIYFPFLGTVVDGFELSGKVNQAVEVKFDLVAKSVGTEAVSSMFTTITPVNTNPLMTAWDGSVKKDTVTLANVVGWTVKTTRNLDLAEVVGSSVLYDIQPKTTKVTGTMELYFSDMALYTAMRAETDVALQINLGPGGTKSYTLDLTAIRIKTWKSAPKDGLMTATVEFESFAPSAGTNTSCMLTRLP